MVIRKTISGLILILFCTGIHAEIPQGYYNSINGKKGSALKTALSRILVEHTVLDYNDMWYYWKRMDAHPDGSVWDMYSNNVRYFNNNDYGVSGMNREHAFPKSWWATSAQVDQYDAYSDLNHLNPSDARANEEKNNYILGETGKSVSFDNGVSKTGPNAYPGSYGNICFEPGDEYKGDFARAYMYMVTCYENYAPQWRSNALQMLNKETYPVFQTWAKEMLLKWARKDKVSTKERDRNEWVYKFQNNRNPFIDFPQLIEYIWGDSVNIPFKVPENYIAHDAVLVTPSNRTEIYFGEVKPGNSKVQTITIRGENLKGNLSVDVYGVGTETDKAYFKLPTTQKPFPIPSQNANSESGYDLSITYTPTKTGEHKAGLVIYDGGIKGSIAVELTGICSQTASIAIPVGVDFPDLYAENSEIIFRAYQPGTKVYIYNVLGKLLYSDVCTGSWQNYSTTQPGIYLVNINGTTKKILVRIN